MSIVRNSAWNTLGVVVPSLVAIPTFAFYARVLGVERLGLLTIALAAMGYASSLDLGLSRALIRQVAIDQDQPATVRSLMSTATLCVFALSLALALGGWLAAPALAGYLKVSADVRPDAIAGFHWLSLTIVPYLLAIVGSAYFEGREDFVAVNVIRTVTALVNAVGGVAALLLSPTLEAALIALFVARLLTCAVTFHWYWVRIKRDAGGRVPAFRADLLSKLLHYGSWLTVSNIVGPLMSHFDRFVLSNISGASVVAFYTVPAEAVVRASMFPSAVSRALFPRLSRGGLSSESDRRIARRLTLSSCALTLLPLFIGANWVLGVWIGPEYVGTPGLVLRILVIGWFFNALALDPFTHLQAKGQSRVTALIHAGELLPYLGLLYVLTLNFGIVGTAVAWTLRSLIDYLLMAFCARTPRAVIASHAPGAVGEPGG